MYNFTMRHEVPQFIEIEDKIFGPLTFKQAIYLAGSVGASFAIYYILGKIDLSVVIRLIFVAPPLALGIALAFVQINKRPFIYFLEAGFYFFINAKRYIWKKKEKKIDSRTDSITTDNFTVRADKIYVPKVSRSKIKDLAWTLDMDIEK